VLRAQIRRQGTRAQDPARALSAQPAAPG
jgi:hypothetical protein